MPTTLRSFILLLVLGLLPLAAASWTPTGDQVQPGRSRIVTLGDGRVLAVHDGGACELWRPTTGTWSPTGSLVVGRTHFTVTAIGRSFALVIGGMTGQDPDLPYVHQIERFNADTGTWSVVGSMITPRVHHDAVRLNDGRVLIAGGLRQAENDLESYGQITLGSTEIVDASGAVTASGSLSRGRNGPTMVTLRSGRVLAVGGYNGASGSLQANADVWSPATGTWTPVLNEFQHAIIDFALAPLANGGALLVGGMTPYAGFDTGPSLVYDPELNQFVSAPLPAVNRLGATATLLRDGRVLLAGGSTSGLNGPAEELASAELYYPWLDLWLPTASMSQPRSSHEATRLRDGRVLVASGTATPDCEIYRPGFWLFDLLQGVLRSAPPLAPRGRG